MDKMIEAGVRVFKIEGRARGPEYVKTVAECYSEAIDACLEGNFTDEKKDNWDARLATVFNRGFWDGYYLGQRLGEWNEKYGSQATEVKVYVGKCTDYFSKIGVGEFLIEAAAISQGNKLLITGNTTGALTFELDDPRVDLKSVTDVPKGVKVSFKTPERVRRGDKLYLLAQAKA
jgi:putative protease